MGIFTNPDTQQQYMSDGVAIYPLEGLPFINEQYVCAMYDISDKKAEKMFFRNINGLPAEIDLSDSVKTESVATLMGISVIIAGISHTAILTERGLMFIEGKYLSPLSDIDSRYLQFYLRYNINNKPIIAVKNGMVLVAMIHPIVISKEFVNSLEELYKQTYIAFTNHQAEQPELVVPVNQLKSILSDEAEEKE